MDRCGRGFARGAVGVLGLGVVLSIGSARAEGEEITVTARKPEADVQETPGPVSFFSNDDLRDLDVRRMEDVARAVPNLSIDSAIGSPSSARIHLRGVGNGDPISSEDPSVGVYLDGVHLSRAQGSLLTLSDIERIEVLPGRQGAALFAKDSIGGAVSITTRKPSFDGFKGSVEARAGNYGRLDSRLSLNVPISPELAAVRFSMATATRDGFVTDQVTGQRLSDDKLLAMRGQLRLLVIRDFEVLMSTEQSIERRKPQGGSCEVTNSRFPGSPGAPAAALFSTFADQTLVGQANAFTENLALALSVPGANTGSAASPLIANNNFLRACQQDLARDEDKVASDLGFQRDHLKTFGTSGTATWALRENLSLRTASAWRRQRPETRRDFDSSAIDLAQSSADAGKAQQDQLSQELQLEGKALDGRLSYVAGVSFFSEKNRDRGFDGMATTTNLFFPISGTRLSDGTPFTTAFDDGNAATGSAQDDALAVLQSAGFVTSNEIRDASPAELQAIFEELGGASGVGGTPEDLRAAAAALASSPLGPNFISKGARTATRLKVENRSLAGYGQLTYNVTQKLSFTTGLRRNVERRRVQKWITYDTAGLAGAVPGLPGDRRFFFDRSERFGDWSPLANLSYRLSDAALVYARFGRASKSGGFNGRAMSSTDPLSTQKIDDEKLTSYEVGLKSQWFDKRLILNVTGFHSIYEDIQLTVVGADRVTQQIQPFVVNAGEAEINGAEVELRARSDFGLDFGASLGVTHARYTEFDPIDPGAGPSGDPEDNRLPNTPTYTLHFGVGYTRPIGRSSALRLHADWTHIGSSGTDVADSRILRKGKHGELDATLTWMLSNGKTEIVVFGSNLLNREYVANGIDFADSFGHATRFYAAPRTYGIELRRQF